MDPNGAAAPFRTKGLTWKGAREFYDKTIPGGATAVVAACTPEIRPYLEQQALPGSWYDVLPIVQVAATAARVAGKSVAELVRENAAFVARRDMGGVYRFLLSMVPPETVAIRLGRLSLQYFDFGTEKSDRVGPKEVRTVRTGIPGPLVDWLGWCIEGFVPVVLDHAGAKKVEVTELSREVAGSRGGVDLYTIEVRIRWS